jgi:hypothetical protein
LLHLNPNLLPGDQINPADPRRWLLVKREMPVPDAASGGDLYSIDFLFADQSAMPTFVERKHYRDPRARREVVGQMMEYAANGQYYWTKDTLRTYAEQSAAENGHSLEAALQALGPDDDEAPDVFFERLYYDASPCQVLTVERSGS